MFEQVVRWTNCSQASTCLKTAHASTPALCGSLRPSAISALKKPLQTQRTQRDAEIAETAHLLLSYCDLWLRVQSPLTAGTWAGCAGLPSIRSTSLEFSPSRFCPAGSSSQIRVCFRLFLSST